MTGLTRANSVRVIDAFVDALNVGELGFEGVKPAGALALPCRNGHGLGASEYRVTLTYPKTLGLLRGDVGRWRPGVSPVNARFYVRERRSSVAVDRVGMFSKPGLDLVGSFLGDADPR